MLYMLYTHKYFSTILAHWGFTHFRSFFLSFSSLRRRAREKPVLRGLPPDRVRLALAARDGGQERLERWRDGLVRPRLEIPLRAPRHELPELLRPGRVLLRRKLVPVWKSTSVSGAPIILH